jgi:hypothetical protein
MSPTRRAFQPPAKGNVICPKCCGETEIDLTPRDPDGWPVGPFHRMTCDFCAGEGEVAEAKWQALCPHDNATEAKTGDGVDVWHCHDCNKTVTGSIPWPDLPEPPIVAANPPCQGWAIFNKEPGK